MSLFPQLRKDPIIDRWVLIAPERAARPGALVAHPEELPDHDAECPFCEGREDRTPPELFALRESNSRPNAPGWRTRVVPNRFPAVRGDVGAHELIVECPRHEASLAALSVEQMADVLRTIQKRMIVRRDDGKWKYAQWFKNHGTAAGASLAHAHSQLICLPEVPANVRLEVDAVRAGRTLNEKCVFCTWVKKERGSGERIVCDDGEFVAICAYAARFPFETWLLPKRHQARFEDTDIEQLAVALRRLLTRLDDVVGRPGYNLILHTGPWTGDDFHWHFELFPRITGIAGFELSAGMFINPLTPEDAARQLQSPPVATGGHY